MQTYPGVLPTESIRRIYQTLAGQADANGATIAWDIWQIQGYLQGFVLGDPQAEKAPSSMATVAMNYRTNLNNTQGLGVLGTLINPEALVGACAIDEGTDVEVDPKGKVTPAAPEPHPMSMAAMRGQALIVDTLAPVLLPMLQRWLFIILERGLQYLINDITGKSQQQEVCCNGGGQPEVIG